MYSLSQCKYSIPIFDACIGGIIEKFFSQSEKFDTNYTNIRESICLSMSNFVVNSLFRNVKS